MVYLVVKVKTEKLCSKDNKEKANPKTLRS